MSNNPNENQIFAAFDLNNNGSLDRMEFARALAMEGAIPAAGGTPGVPSRQPLRGNTEVTLLNESSLQFNKMDANGDGKISEAEFFGTNSSKND